MYMTDIHMYAYIIIYSLGYMYIYMYIYKTKPELSQMFKINLFDPWVLKLEVGQNANTLHGFSVFHCYSNLSIYHKHFYTHSSIIAIIKPLWNLTLGRSIILYDDLITNYTFLSFQLICLYEYMKIYAICLYWTKHFGGKNTSVYFYKDVNNSIYILYTQ